MVYLEPLESLYIIFMLFFCRRLKPTGLTFYFVTPTWHFLNFVYLDGLYFWQRSIFTLASFMTSDQWLSITTSTKGLSKETNFIWTKQASVDPERRHLRRLVPSSSHSTLHFCSPLCPLFHFASLFHTSHPMVADMCLSYVSDFVSPIHLGQAFNLKQCDGLPLSLLSRRLLFLQSMTGPCLLLFALLTFIHMSCQVWSCGFCVQLVCHVISLPPLSPHLFVTAARSLSLWNSGVRSSAAISSIPLQNHFWKDGFLTSEDMARRNLALLNRRVR